MEKLKKKIEDPNVAEAFNHVVRKAFGNPIVLKSAPTNSTMKSNTWGIYGSDIYIKTQNNVTLKIAGTSV